MTMKTKKKSLLIRFVCVCFQDVVIMGVALEKAFYEKLAEMPSDVRGN